MNENEWMKMNEWMNNWKSEWISEWVNEWMWHIFISESISDYTSSINECPTVVSEWMSEWVNSLWIQ